MPKLSVVVPAYRDELSILVNFLTLKAALEPHVAKFSFEIILVNDGSPDNTILALEKLRSDFPSIVGVVNLTRNFGQVAAIYAGLAQCTGDCAAVISSDLQDPPELITDMFNLWLNGAKTVIGVRESRDDSSFSRIASASFYKLMQRYALPEIPASGFDFFLLDRIVLNRLLESTEQNGFLQGHILSASGSVVQLPYRRRARRLGRSGWTTLRKLKYFVDGFVAYSFVPIRLIALLGIVVFLFAILLSLGLILQRVFWGTLAPGWSSVMIALLVLHGFELLAIGIVGEYVWRALAQVRPRPLYSIEYYKPPQAGAEQ